MKKILLAILIISVLFSAAIPKTAYAYEQNFGICYSQCAAYKFYWKGDACWDFVQMSCGTGKVAFAKTVIDMLTLAKDTGYGSPAAAMSAVAKALFCAAVINDCVAPRLDACKSACENYPTYYAPNLEAGTGWASTPGVVYSKYEDKLFFRVTNTGAGYASDITVTAKIGYTAERDGEVTEFTPLFEDTIEHLLFMGSRQSAPKGAIDTVKDFLIDQSNFSDYLSKYKSDAGKEFIPPLWMKKLDFTAPEDILTKVVLTVDPENIIPESNENDNEFIALIDNRPTKARLQFFDASMEMPGSDLTKRDLSVKIRNNGEEAANGTIKVYSGRTTDSQVLASEDVQIDGKEEMTWQKQISLNLEEDFKIWNKVLLVEIIDQYNRSVSRHIYTVVHHGSISGRVTNNFGDPVEGATVETDAGHSVVTNDRGFYEILPITTLGDYTITAFHSDYDQDATEQVTIDLTNDSFEISADDENLHLRSINFVLKNSPAKVSFKLQNESGDSISEAKVLLINDNFRYEHDLSEGNTISVEKGSYRVQVNALGFKPIFEERKIETDELTLEYTLEKLLTRTSDEGFRVIKPQLLWEKNLKLDKGFQIARFAASKDGNLLLLYTVKTGEENSGKLHFINALTGKIINQVAVPNSRGNPQVAIDMSWDGSVVSYYTAILAKVSRDSNRRNVLKLFNGQGEEILSKDFEPGSAESCDLSPDGFYLHPGRLVNNSGYVYTHWDTQGKENSEMEQKFRPYNTLHFLIDNTIVGACKEKSYENYCRTDIHENNLHTFANIKNTRSIDSSANGESIAIQTTKKVYFYKNGSEVWEKETKSGNGPYLVSVSPGGEYASVMNSAHTSDKDALKLFDAEGNNLIDDYDLIYTEFATANDQGVFYLKQPWREGPGAIEYYQLARYPKAKVSDKPARTGARFSSTAKKAVAAAGVAGTAGLGIFLAKKQGFSLAKLLKSLFSGRG